MRVMYIIYLFLNYKPTAQVPVLINLDYLKWFSQVSYDIFFKITKNHSFIHCRKNKTTI
jgi:hypothetical protein